MQGWLSSIQDFLQRVTDGMASCNVDGERVQRIAGQVRLCALAWFMPSLPMCMGPVVQRCCQTQNDVHSRLECHRPLALS